MSILEVGKCAKNGYDKCALFSAVLSSDQDFRSLKKYMPGRCPP